MSPHTCDDGHDCGGLPFILRAYCDGIVRLGVSAAEASAGSLGMEFSADDARQTFRDLAAAVRELDEPGRAAFLLEFACALEDAAEGDAEEPA